jgi:hypothetical protein
LIFAFVGPCLYALTAIGLYYRIPLAGFLAWFIFIGPGVAEFTHFIFPLLRPALDPTLPAAITAMVSNGRLVAEMPNYWIGATGRYYFRPVHSRTPDDSGIYAIVRLARSDIMKVFVAGGGVSAQMRAMLQKRGVDVCRWFAQVGPPSRRAAAATVRLAEAGRAGGRTTWSTINQRPGRMLHRDGGGRKPLPPRRLPRWLTAWSPRAPGRVAVIHRCVSLEREGQERARLAATVHNLPRGNRSNGVQFVPGGSEPVAVYPPMGTQAGM